MSAARNTSPVARVVVLGLALLGVSVAAIVFAPGGTAPLRAAPLWLALVVAVAFGVAERAVFHLEHRREAISFSLSEVPSLYALVFLDIRLAVAVRIVGALSVLWLTRRPPLHKLLFNAGLFALEIAVGACVLRTIVAWSDGSMTWVLAGGVIAVGLVTVVGSLFVCAAIAQFEGDFFGKAVTELRSSVWIFALNATIAGLTLAPALVTPWLSLFAIAPIAILWIFVQQQGAIGQTLRDVEAIQGFAGRIAGEVDLRGIGRAGVDETTRLLRARQAGLVIFDGEAALMTISTGPPLDGLPASTDDPRWRAVLLDADEAHPDGRRVDDMCAVPVLSDQGAVGLLVVRGREGALDSFTDTDLRRLRTLADQLAAAVGRGLMHRHLEFEAHHDLLTGLANRASFERDLDGIRERALEQESMAFVVMFDLDRFKEVNDTLGHHAGDQLLIEIAHRLTAMPEPGDLLARFAGDEFALSGVRSTIDEIDTLVRACIAAVARPFSIDGLELVVNASAGVATQTPEADNSTPLRRSTDAEADSARLLRRADIAMYHAKQNHLGHEFYRDEIDRRTPARLSMLADLRTAIDRSGIELHFQPKLDLVSNVVSGAEVLARWTHPTRGSVPPIDFIRVAEESGLIRSLTDLVLEGSIGAIAALDQRGHRLSLAVNLSTQDLLDELLGDRIERRLDQFGIEPARLTLEITEGTLLYDGPRTRSTIERLHRIGVHLSIDDFGTGYSSLSYLRQLPVTELKIDRSFVTNLVVDAQDETIVRSTIDLGHNLGLQVVAEGVETNEVADRLRALGCDVAQGYGICRPLPFDQLTKWLVNTTFATRQADPARPLPW
jgi:diguanylate cyclase (GGDEF)-like protein